MNDINLRDGADWSSFRDRRHQMKEPAKRIQRVVLAQIVIKRDDGACLVVDLPPMSVRRARIDAAALTAWLAQTKRNQHRMDALSFVANTNNFTVEAITGELNSDGDPVNGVVAWSSDDTDPDAA